MFGIGMPELIIILIIVLLVFGASKVPAIGAGFGSGIRNFKKTVSGSGEADPEQDSKPVV